MFVEITAIITVCTILYINFLYITLWFDNKNKFSEVLKVKRLPRVSIITPAYNEAKNIKRLAANISKLNYPKNKLEVILIDDSSADNTYNEMKKIPKNGLKIKIFRNQKREGKAKSLNIGLANAKHEFVAVIDADSYLEKNALLNCMKYFDNEKVGAVTTNILVRRENSLLQRLQNLEFMIISSLRKLQESMNVIMVTPGPLSVFRRDVLLSLGGFDENNLTEDIEIAWRLLTHNYQIRMAFDAKVWSDYPSSLKAWWNQRTRWNLGGFQTLIKHFKWIRKDSQLRKFLIPFSLSGYALTILGVCIAAYLISNSFINFFSYVLEVMALGSNPFSSFSIRFLIDLFTLYGLIIFFTSLYFMKIGVSNHKHKKISILSLVLFPTAYILLFPVVLVYSFFKFMSNERRWLTK